MLYCMESLGRSYVEEDETYDLFEKVLIDYLPFANDNAELKVNDLHTKYFLALEELYSMSKSKDASDMNSEEKMADSLAWYKACGLIYIKEGNYYINSEALKRKFLEYEEYKEKKMNGSYTKGSKK